MPNRRLYITIKDLQKLSDIKQDAAYKELRRVKDALGKRFRWQKVTFNEYAAYRDINVQEIYEALDM